MTVKGGGLPLHLQFNLFFLPPPQYIYVCLFFAKSRGQGQSLDNIPTNAMPPHIKHSDADGVCSLWIIKHIYIWKTQRNWTSSLYKVHVLAHFHRPYICLDISQLVCVFLTPSLEMPEELIFIVHACCWSSTSSVASLFEDTPLKDIFSWFWTGFFFHCKRVMPLLSYAYNISTNWYVII